MDGAIGRTRQIGSTPKVMRRIEVPLSIRLDRLHTAIQVAMGWTDTHLYEFRFAGDATFGIPDPDYLADMIDARKPRCSTPVSPKGVFRRASGAHLTR